MSTTLVAAATAMKKKSIWILYTEFAHTYRDIETFCTNNNNNNNTIISIRQSEHDEEKTISLRKQMFVCNKLNEFSSKKMETSLQIWEKLSEAVAYKPGKSWRTKTKNEFKAICSVFYIYRWRKKPELKSRKQRLPLFNTQVVLSIFSFWKLNVQAKASTECYSIHDYDFLKFQTSFRSICSRGANDSIDAVTQLLI